MLDEAIIEMCEVRVRAMRLIGGNLLNTLLIILMSIAHRFSLLRISSVMMSPYHGGIDRVVIGSIWVCQCMWQCTGRQRMGWISGMMHAGGQGL